MKNYYNNSTLAMIPPMGYDMTRTNPGSFGERARSLSDLSACNTKTERIGSCFFFRNNCFTLNLRLNRVHNPFRFLPTKNEGSVPTGTKEVLEADTKLERSGR